MIDYPVGTRVYYSLDINLYDKDIWVIKYQPGTAIKCLVRECDGFCLTMFNYRLIYSVDKLVRDEKIKKLLDENR